MRLKKLALGTAAALGLAGLAGAAAAAAQNSHVLTVQLPDGATAHITYVGDTPPQVRVVSAQPFAPAAWPGSTAGFVDPGFPALDRVMAEMDHEAALMRAQALQMMSAAASGDGLVRADTDQSPPGLTGYAVVSTVSTRGGCTRAVQYRSTGEGSPQVISRTSGNCGAAKAPSGAKAPSATNLADARSTLRLTEAAYRKAS